MDDAGAALARVAADMGAGQAQVLAQELHEQRARLDIAGDGLAVHRHADGGHVFLLLAGRHVTAGSSFAQA